MINITLFAQIINKLDKSLFKNLIVKYQSDKHEKGINSWTHLISMLFLHFAKASSLREISNGLKSATGNLNHLGIIKKTPSKSSLSYINKHRKWRLFSDYYYQLLNVLKQQAKFRQIKFKIKKKIFLLDSTTISLCLSLYDWAYYKKLKGAIKLHTVLDYDSCLPDFVHVTTGKKADNVIAHKITLQPNTVIVADRGYLDFPLLKSWNETKVKFVVRLKDNVKYIEMKERPLPEGKNENILKDEEIRLIDSYENYNKNLRRIAVYDTENDQTIELITNNFYWTASTIAELYKQRWQIEIFFKELKNHIKIKTFVGVNENAVMIQIWTALITILIMKYLKQISQYGWCLSNLIAFLRMNLFVKIDLHQWLNEPFKPPDEIFEQLQLKLF